MNLRTALFIDAKDEPRDVLPNAKPWVLIRNYQEFVDYLENNPLPDFISFNHDLANEHTEDYLKQVMEQGYQEPRYQDYKEKTGLDCAMYLIEMIQAKSLTELPSTACHSPNPIGARNIVTCISGFQKHLGFVPNIFTWTVPIKQP